VSIVKPYPKGNDQGWPGWKFDASYPNATPDKLFGSEYLHEVYFKADKDYKGKYTVPALWDTESGTMVCNVCVRIAIPTLYLLIVSARKVLKCYAGSRHPSMD